MDCGTPVHGRCGGQHWTAQMSDPASLGAERRGRRADSLQGVGRRGGHLPILILQQLSQRTGMRRSSGAELPQHLDGGLPRSGALRLQRRRRRRHGLGPEPPEGRGGGHANRGLGIAEERRELGTVRRGRLPEPAQCLCRGAPAAPVLAPEQCRGLRARALAETCEHGGRRRSDAKLGVGANGLQAGALVEQPTDDLLGPLLGHLGLAAYV
mmetsp:Transcript_84405/g.272841  ORF Transcript_84405/g.272841 Transcript_84405/m.272841 type:complete len:211 (-) Transcript_84405:352-984(-)